MDSYHKNLSDLKDPYTFIELADIFSNIVFNCLFSPTTPALNSQVVCGITALDTGDDEEIYLVEVEEKNTDEVEIGGHMYKLIINLSVLFYSAGLKPSANEKGLWITLSREDLEPLIALHKETTLTPEIRPDDVIPLLQ